MTPISRPIVTISNRSVFALASFKLRRTRFAILIGVAAPRVADERSVVPRGGDQQTHENNGLLKNGTQRCPNVSHSLFREGSRPRLIRLEHSGKPTGPHSFPTARREAGTKSSAPQDGYR